MFNLNWKIVVIVVVCCVFLICMMKCLCVIVLSWLNGRCGRCSVSFIGELEVDELLCCVVYVLCLCYVFLLMVWILLCVVCYVFVCSC